MSKSKGAPDGASRGEVWTDVKIVSTALCTYEDKRGRCCEQPGVIIKLRSSHGLYHWTFDARCIAHKAKMFRGDPA